MGGWRTGATSLASASLRLFFTYFPLPFFAFLIIFDQRRCFYWKPNATRFVVNGLSCVLDFYRARSSVVWCMRLTCLPSFLLTD